MGLKQPCRGQTDPVFKGVNYHKCEVNDFACGIKFRRGPPAALPGADAPRYSWCDSAHYPCAARRAANDKIIPMAVPDQALLFQKGQLAGAATNTTKQIAQISF
jgi:hypothetical protein